MEIRKVERETLGEDRRDISGAKVSESSRRQTSFCFDNTRTF